jgi:hypothetical protein
MTLIVVEVRPKGVMCWHTENAESFINAAITQYGMIYEEWDMAKARKRFGGYIPPDLEEKLNEVGTITEINWGEDAANSQLYEPVHAPSRLDVAKQAVFYGALEGFVLSMSDAEAFATGKLSLVSEGHRDAARSAVTKAMIVIENLGKAKRRADED